jgi:tRNA(Ser,Leu) C12 N-acetylase TAN1
MPDQKYLARIQIMKKEKAIEEHDYRYILKWEFNVQSSKELENHQAVVFIRRLRDFHKDVYAPSDEIIWKIKNLWHQIYRGDHEIRDLRKFLWRHVKVSDLNFLDRRKAYECVEGLKAMQNRRDTSHIFNP